MRNWDPNAWFWGEALDMLDRAERLQRSFFQFHGAPDSIPAWAPPVDVFEQGDELVVVLALPDVAPNRVEVLRDGQFLVVRGERPLPQVCRRAVIRQLEIPYGPFERRIALPAASYELVRQSYGEGCLVLTLDRRGRREGP